MVEEETLGGGPKGGRKEELGEEEWVSLNTLSLKCRHSILYLWFNQREWLEWPSMYLRKSWLHYMHQFVPALHASACLCVTCINSFIAYHKNDLEIQTVTTVFLVSKSDHWIKRHRMIKFAWSTCIVSR